MSFLPRLEVVLTDAGLIEYRVFVIVAGHAGRPALCQELSEQEICVIAICEKASFCQVNVSSDERMPCT